MYYVQLVGLSQCSLMSVILLFINRFIVYCFTCCILYTHHTKKFYKASTRSELVAPTTALISNNGDEV